MRQRYTLPLIFLELVAGIVFLAVPQYISGLLWIICAVFFIVVGVYEFVRYVVVTSRDKKMGERYAVFMIRAILMIIFGTVLLRYNSIFVTIASIVFGIFFITEGFIQLSKSFGGNSVRGALKWFMIVASVLSAALGIIIIINPWGGIVTVMRLIGAALVVSAVEQLMEGKGAHVRS